MTKLGLYEKALCFNLEWEQKLELAKSSGFDFVEINIDGTEQRLPRLYEKFKTEVAAIRHGFDATGVPVCTMALTAHRHFPLGSESGEVRGKGIDCIVRAADFAAQTGIRAVHIAGYDELGGKCSAQTEKNFYAAVESILPVAAQAGIIFAVETMDTPFMGTVENIMRLVRYFDSPYLQCYADIGNLTAFGHSPSIELPKAGKHLVGLHLKDAKEKVFRDVPFGEGIVDFDAAFEALRKMKYAGFMAAEMWCYDKEEFHAYLPKAAEFLRNKLNYREKRG
jgi:L-ribulose-5-phosphate 3-epimerase